MSCERYYNLSDYIGLNHSLDRNKKCSETSVDQGQVRGGERE